MSLRDGSYGGGGDMYEGEDQGAPPVQQIGNEDALAGIGGMANKEDSYPMECENNNMDSDALLQLSCKN